MLNMGSRFPRSNNMHKDMTSRHITGLLMAVVVMAAGCSQEYAVTEHEGYSILSQKRGPALGYSDVEILYQDGHAFMFSYGVLLRASCSYDGSCN